MVSIINRIKKIKIHRRNYHFIFMDTKDLYLVFPILQYILHEIIVKCVWTSLLGPQGLLGGL